MDTHIPAQDEALVSGGDAAPENSTPVQPRRFMSVMPIINPPSATRSGCPASPVSDSNIQDTENNSPTFKSNTSRSAKPLTRIMMSRQLPFGIDFLCSFDDDTNFQMCQWVSANNLRSIPNYAQHLQYFNEKNTDVPIWTNGNFRNSPLSAVEVIAQNDSEFLFRVNTGDMNVFVWDHTNGTASDALIHDFLKELTTVPHKLSEGTAFLTKSTDNFIFEGDKTEVASFIQLSGKNTVIVCEESEFENWCILLEQRVKIVGYRGDDFSRGIARQFQMKGQKEVVLMTYSSMKSDIRYLEEYHFDIVIFDSAEKIRSPNCSLADALRRLNADIKGAVGVKIQKCGLSALKEILGDKCQVYLHPVQESLKCLMLPPTTEQIHWIKACTSDWSRIKCCQHPLTVHLPDGRPRQHLLSTLSAKFVFLLDFVRQYRNQRMISIVFHSKSLRKYFGELLDTMKIPYGDENSCEIAIQLCLGRPGRNKDVIFSVDGETIGAIRLIVEGSIEHRILIEENSALAKPKVLITLDASLSEVDSTKPYLPFPGLEGCDNFLTLNDILNLRKEAMAGNFSANLVSSYVIALFRRTPPHLVFQYPLLIYELSQVVQNFDLTLILCEKRPDWLTPITAMNPEVESFRRFKNLFKHSTRTLEKIEQLMIGREFGKHKSPLKLPPNYYYTEEQDTEIIESLTTGRIPVNCAKRIHEVITIMKSELLGSGFVKRYCPPFWTKPEVMQLLTAMGEFGSQITNFTLTNMHAKTCLMSKTAENLQEFGVDLLAQFSRRKQALETVVVQSHAPPKLLKCGIPSTISITYDEYRPIFQNIETHTLIGTAVDCMLAKTISNACSCNLDYQMCSRLFHKIRVEFGMSFRNELLLSPDSPFHVERSHGARDFLTGKFPVRVGISSNELPECFTNDSTFQQFVRSIVDPSSSTPTKESPKSNRGYTVSPALLRRVAELQQQTDAEKKTRAAHTARISHTQEKRKTTNNSTSNPENTYFVPNPELVKRAAELDAHSRTRHQEMKDLTPIKKRPRPVIQPVFVSETNKDSDK